MLPVSFLLISLDDLVEPVVDDVDDVVGKQFGVKAETVKKLRNQYGDEAAAQTLNDSVRATNINDMDGFVLSEAKKNFSAPGTRPPRTATAEDAGIDVTDPFGNDANVLRKAKNEFNRAMIDEDSEMISMLRRLDKQDGGDRVQQWLFDTNKVRASNSIANARIRNSADIDEALGGLGKKDLKEFDDYVAARAEAANYGDLPTSRSLDELNAVVSAGDAKYGDRFAALNTYYKKLAKRMYENGLIDDSQLKFYLDQNDYVRIQRDMSDLVNPGQGASRSRSLGSTKAAQKRTGSQRDILESSKTVLKRTQEIELEVQRNMAANNIIDTLEEAGLATRVADGKGKNTVSRFINGKKEFFEVPKDVKRVIDNVNPYQLGVIAKVVSAPARVFRAGTTALSAPFTVTNYMRDQLQSGIYSRKMMATHHPKNIISGLWEANADFFNEADNTLWKNFEEFAGDQTIYDELRNAKSSRRILREIRLGKRGKYGNMVTSPVRTLEDLNSITEKATRFQNYKGIYEDVLKKTGDQDLAIREAVQAAYQNSVNFQRMGTFSRQVNMLIPYFNAGIQGSRNIARSLRDRPLATSMKIAGFVAIPGMATTAYNMSDPRRREIYESINEFEKENNFILISPWAKQREDGSWEGIIKVPKPQGYREIADPSRLITERFLGDKDPIVAADIAQNIAQGFLGPINIEDEGKFVSSVTPQIVKPYLHQKLNRDLYKDSEIVPEYMLNETDDPRLRAYKGTSGTARWIANQLGIEPIRIEKFVEDTFGSLGRYGINTSDNFLASQDLIPDEQIGGRSIKGDFSRRLFEATGEKLDENKTEGQLYFERLKEATSGLSEQEQEVWNSLHPKKTNFLGEDIFDEDKRLSRYAKAGLYLQYPAVLEAERELNRQSVEAGGIPNPLWELPDDQLRKVLMKRALPPGAEDPELSNLWQEDWYQEFQASNDEFYSAISEKMTADGKEIPKQQNPYPEISDDLLAAQSAYFDLPKGTGARSAWIRNNPETWAALTTHWNAKQSWEDKERELLGLKPEEKDEEESGGSGGYYNSSGKWVSSGGGGSRGVRVNAKTGSFGQKRALNVGNVKIKKDKKRKVVKKNAPKTVKIKRNKTK